MALRSNSKERRSHRPRGTSPSSTYLDHHSSHHPTPPGSPLSPRSPRRGGSPGVATTTNSLLRRLRRNRIGLIVLISTCSIICLFLYWSSTPSETSRTNPTNGRKNHSFVEGLIHPNFDFDHHYPDEPEQALSQHHHQEHTTTTIEEEEEEEGEEEEEETKEVGEEWKRVLPSTNPPSSQPTAIPFLPYSCDPCSTTSSLLEDSLSPPVCTKYQPQSTISDQGVKTISTPSLSSDVLERGVMFEGTGRDVRRVLKRAVKSSLYGVKREREEGGENLGKFQDEESFRILILGGSVSNCRGVDQKTTCWHARVLRWFQQTLPMEGDRELVPEVPSGLVTKEPIGGPTRLDQHRENRRKVKRSSEGIVEVEGRRNLKRAVGKGKRDSSKKKKKSRKKTKKKPSSSTSRQRPSTRLINGSKSATGSSFFAYCYSSEMALRGKNFELGSQGPDLIILEYGVNDVYPHDEIAIRDFEKHLRQLKALPSKPAVIVLEAASLLLATTTGFEKNAEYLHLPPAQFYDVPVLSVKQSLFTGGGGATKGDLKMKDLFLPDQHHPNERGHELMADVLIAYLERQLCSTQSEILSTANTRLRSQGSNVARREVEPEVDIGRRSEEVPVSLPRRSLFTPYPAKEGLEEEWELPEPRCLQVGNSKETVEPIRNNGWEKFGWARDKQYLVASKPGSSVTFEIEVGKGGTILADWLRSRFYDLGDVSVYLDEDRSKAVTLTGYWDLGWSIGVPTEIFTGIAAGLHRITFEVLGEKESSHPNRKTSFRLIGIIST
ncbi:SGNH/GDSL hydrolase family protein [Sporobolomyces salmoneus]|uniref:SGNH/GDSL hydrolase family protein n=1 Tax=Sporobolomyces salmoneus TaxID=183962 RepID=UPI003170EFEB